MGWKAGIYRINPGPTSGTQFDFPFIYQVRSTVGDQDAASTWGTLTSKAEFKRLRTRNPRLPGHPPSAGCFQSKQPFLPPSLYLTRPWPLNAPSARSPPTLPGFLLACVNLPSLCIASSCRQEACDPYRGNRAHSVDWLPCSLRDLRYLKPTWASFSPLSILPQSLQSLGINSSHLFSGGFTYCSLLGFQGLGYWRVKTLDQHRYLFLELPLQGKRRPSRPKLRLQWIVLSQKVF